MGLSIEGFVEATLAKTLPGVSDTIVQGCEVLRFMKEKGCIKGGGGGDGIEGRVRVASSGGGGAVTDYSGATAATTDVFEKWSDAWRQYMWGLFISDFKRERNESISASKVFDMFATDVAEKQQVAQDWWAKRCYLSYATKLTGDVGTPPNGLLDVISATNTFLNLSRTTYSAWQAQVDTLAAADFKSDPDADGQVEGIRKLEALWMACSGGKAPDSSVGSDLATVKSEPEITITSQTAFKLYSACMQERYRYTGDSADPMKKLAFMGRPIVWCTYSPDRFFMLNSKYITLEYVGGGLVRKLKTIETSTGQQIYIGGQAQMYSRNPRYLGMLTLT